MNKYSQLVYFLLYISLCIIVHSYDIYDQFAISDRLLKLHFYFGYISKDGILSSSPPFKAD